MKRIAFPCLCLLLLAVMSCQRDTAALRSALTRAEAVMEENPQEAQQILDSLIVSREIVISEEIIPKQSSEEHSSTHYSLFTNHSKSDLALWAMLKTQADYKCFVPLTSDSLALIATDYYGTPRRKNYHAAMAWYTLGCVYTETQDDPKAISAYLKARDCFPDTTSRYYSLTLQNLGRHYLKRNMLEEAFASFTRFRDASEAIGDSASVAFARYFLGFTRLLQFDYEAADSLFDLSLGDSALPEFYHNEVLLHKAKIAFYSRDDHPQAFSYLRACHKEMPSDSLFAAGFCLMGDIFASENRLDSAYYYYRKALVSKDELYSMATTYHHLGDVIMQLHHADEAKECIDHYDELLDSIYRRRNRYDVSAAAYAFETEKREATYRSSLRLYYVYGIASAAVLALAVLLFIEVRRSRRKEQSLKVHESLRRSELALARTNWVQWTELNDDDKARRITEYADTLAQCLSIFRQTPSEHILLLLEKKDTRLTAKMAKSVADDIGKSFIDVIQFLRMETLPEAAKISEADWLLCILSYLRLPQGRIAGLLSIEKDSVRKKRRRLEGKIPAEILALFFSSRDDKEE